MVMAIEDAELEYEPGTRIEYHEHTFGWLVGELVARISGMPVNRFFEQEVFRPLGMSGTWFVLPDSEIDRVAPWSPCRSRNMSSSPRALTTKTRTRRSFRPATALRPPGTWRASTTRWPEAGVSGGVRWLSEQTVEEATRCWADLTDPETGRRRRMALGMRLSEGEFDKFGTAGESPTFGHGGFGSCETWGDPQLKVRPRT